MIEALSLPEFGPGPDRRSDSRVELFGAGELLACVAVTDERGVAAATAAALYAAGLDEHSPVELRADWYSGCGGFADHWASCDPFERCPRCGLAGAFCRLIEPRFAGADPRRCLECGFDAGAEEAARLEAEREHERAQSDDAWERFWGRLSERDRAIVDHALGIAFGGNGDDVAAELEGRGPR
jgi:hypothetical protein